MDRRAERVRAGLPTSRAVRPGLQIYLPFHDAVPPALIGWASSPIFDGVHETASARLDELENLSLGNGIHFHTSPSRLWWRGLHRRYGPMPVSVPAKYEGRDQWPDKILPRPPRQRIDQAITALESLDHAGASASPAACVCWAAEIQPHRLVRARGRTHECRPSNTPVAYAAARYWSK